MIILVCFLFSKTIIYCYLQLVLIRENKIKLLKFLLDNKLIKRVQKCPRCMCHRNMSIIHNAGRKDGFVFGQMFQM